MLIYFFFCINHQIHINNDLKIVKFQDLSSTLLWCTFPLQIILIKSGFRRRNIMNLQIRNTIPGINERDYIFIRKYCDCVKIEVNHMLRSDLWRVQMHAISSYYEYYNSWAHLPFLLNKIINLSLSCESTDPWFCWMAI